VQEIQFLPAAREEFLAAADHYDAASPGLGNEFISEVERALSRIAAFPEHDPPYVSGTRRVVLRKFPFNVVYFQGSNVIVIVALAHQRKRPFYWRLRL
jgi:toxin ParE1/3/4